MELNVMNFLMGFVLSGVIAMVIERRGALTFSGNLGAILLGTVIYGFNGAAWLTLILAFFFTSSLLSNYRMQEKTGIAGEKFQKFGARDFWQVLANGGLPAVIAAVYFIHPDPRLFVAYAGVLAATTADTWGTELGVLSRQKPLFITTLKPVDTGTSGAFSPLGSAFAILGALFIAAVTVGLSSVTAEIFHAAAIASAGVMGAVVDSFAGATIQSVYWCPVCKKETERQVHRCGTRTRKIRGWDWVDNDSVNLFAAIAGAAASVALFQALAGL